MKKLSFVVVAIILLSGCHKIIEQKAQDAIVKAMTQGQWEITNFTSNGTDMTANFSGYTFQYLENYTVNAIKNGTVEKTGTWQGDVNTMSISANFPSAVDSCLLLWGTCICWSCVCVLVIVARS